MTILLENFLGKCMAGEFYINKNGNAAIEFALVIPLFLMVLFGSVQFGLIFLTKAEMSHVARNASRLLSVEELTISEVQAYVNASLTGWGEGGYTTAVERSSDVFTVTISIHTESITFFPVFPEDMFGATIMSSASMRAEGAA